MDQIHKLAFGAKRQIENYFDRNGGCLAGALDRVEEIIEICRKAYREGIMENTLKVILTETADHRPLATIQNFPGLDADLYPDQLRRLAGALLAAADDCEARDLKRKHLTMVKKAYPL